MKKITEKMVDKMVEAMMESMDRAQESGDGELPIAIAEMLKIDIYGEEDNEETDHLVEIIGTIGTVLKKHLKNEIMAYVTANDLHLPK